MSLININSNQELQDNLKKHEKSYLLLYKKGTDASDCAYRNLEAVAEKETIFVADVNSVRDIHPQYAIKTVPVLLSFSESNLKNQLKGCNDSKYYKNYFDNEVFSSSNKAEGKSQPSVTVYSTPTCSWCTRIKNYFKEKGIRFRDVDVSKDQKAAEEMVKKSGQQGVPQTLIGSQIIVGFDKAKIDKLLGL